MRIAVNTRLLLKGKLEGIGWFTSQTLERIVKQHPEHEFIFFFDRPYDPQFVFAPNVTPVVVHPQARHPVLRRASAWAFAELAPAAACCCRCAAGVGRPGGAPGQASPRRRLRRCGRFARRDRAVLRAQAARHAPGDPDDRCARADDHGPARHGELVRCAAGRSSRRWTSNWPDWAVSLAPQQPASPAHRGTNAACVPTCPLAAPERPQPRAAAPPASVAPRARVLP